MPLFSVTMKVGRAAVEKNAISRAIHEASVKAGYPDDDLFQRFFCLEPADLRVDLNYPGLPKPRTAKMLMIEVLVSSGTDAARLHAAIETALDASRLLRLTSCECAASPHSSIPTTSPNRRTRFASRTASAHSRATNLP